MRFITSHFSLLAGTLILTFSLSGLQSQTAVSVDPKTVPVVDAGVGSCSADFTVVDPATAPVYAATVKVHIAYGFLNTHKLDLEVGTNAFGKARFTGLPDKSKQGFFFHASQGDREGSAFVDPAKTCKATLTIALENKYK